MTLPEQISISSLFGTLDFQSLSNESNSSDPYFSSMTNGYIHNRHVRPEGDENVHTDPSTNHLSKNFSFNPIEPISSLATISNIPKKRLLWQIEYFSVPYYVRTYGNQLFICDKYG